MKNYELRLWFKEFPFLGKVLETIYWESNTSLDVLRIWVKIGVKKIDESLMKERGWTSDCDQDYEVFLSVIKGQIKPLLFNDDQTLGESLTEELFSNGEPASAVEYIIKCTNYDKERSWTIYKAGNFNQLDYALGIIDEASAEIKKQITAAFQD